MSAPESQITQADIDAHRRGREMEHNLKSIVTLIVTGCVLFVFDVHAVMLYSKKLNDLFLYLAYFGYALFFVIAGYLHFVIGSDKAWEDTHMYLIYTATISTVTAGVLWCIALWPVYHFWVFPLGLAALFFGISVLDWVPIGNKKKQT